MQAILRKNITTVKNLDLTSYMSGNLRSISNYGSFVPSYGFAELSVLSSVYMPNASYIGSYAFSECTELIPANCVFSAVDKIYEGAFKEAFVDSEESGTIQLLKCSEIDRLAFYEANLDGISIPKCVSIAESAFHNCKKLSQVSGSNCEFLGSYAFADATSLIEADFSKCTHVGDGVFKSCVNLSSVDLRNLPNLDKDIFGGCVNLSHLRLDNCSQITDDESIGYFRDLDSLSYLYMPNMSTFKDVKFNSALKTLSVVVTGSEIYSSMFEYQPSIETIYINTESKVTSIGLNAFMSCYNLKDLYGGLSEIRHICSSAFYKCDLLKYIPLDMCEQVDDDAFAYCGVQNVNLPICSELGAAFKGCGVINLQAPMVKSIQSQTFAECYQLVSAFLDTCNKVGEYAFDGCTKLQSVSMPACYELGSYAFRNCMSFKNADFPGVAIVNEHLFDNVALESINFPGITIVRGQLAAYNPNLLYINIGGNARNRYNSIYTPDYTNPIISNCTNVVSYIFGASRISEPHVKGICDQTCVVNNLILPNASEIYANAFYAPTVGYSSNIAGCFKGLSASLCSVVGANAFNPGYPHAGRLEYINLPKCTMVATSAFIHHDALTKVTLPAVKTIHNSAFFIVTSSAIDDCPYYDYTFPQSSVVTFNGTPFGLLINGEYHYSHVNILVPNSLYDRYKSTYANTVYGSRILAMSD